MSERELLFEIRKHVGALPGVALFRNQSGTYEEGWKAAAKEALRCLMRGDYRGAVDALRNARIRHITYGLVKGASDLIGIVAPHGRFLALEVKTQTGRPTKEQVMFADLVNKLGGVGRIVRSVEEAEAAVEAARQEAAVW